MNFKKAILVILALLPLIFLGPALATSNVAFAEDKNTPSEGMIPKLPKTPNDPELTNGHVYPNWGPVCQRYTYSVIYKDKDGRKPEYVKIYFNGKMIDMQPAFDKSTAGKESYKNGVKYDYKYVPNKLGSNFYYFEASNGLGKTRGSIIDSPDNGPVLFKSAFDKNEIAVIEKQSGKKILSFSTGQEWIGGIGLSDDGKYLAAKASKHIYLFDTSKPERPLWSFVCEQCRIGDDVKGGVAISGDGSKIIAAFGEKVALFGKSSNKPIWIYSGGNSYNVAISKDGKYMAAATAGEELNLNSNLLILWNDKSEKPLWQYHSSGNFHDVSLSRDGSLIAGSTGCPDRRFYLFSKDSNKPLIKSDPLTRDSPVHRAKISADGKLAAVGSESDAGAVFLFSKNKGQVWKFPTPRGSSVRALNFTPDGKYIGASTFDGQAYIFESRSSTPITSWVVNNTALGGIDIADDGSFIATGGTDNKLHIFDRNKKTGIEIPFNEHLEEIDISASGKYIATGTGGSVYFFESFDKNSTPIPCTTVVEPKSEEEAMAEAGINTNGQQISSSLCGDGKCESPETTDNCRVDCDQMPDNKPSDALISGIRNFETGWRFGFLATLLTLAFYLGLIRFNLLKRPTDKLPKFNQKIFVALVSLTILLLLLTAAAFFLNKPQFNPIPENTEQTKSKPGKILLNEGQKPVLNKGEQNPSASSQETGVCGNDICEPGLGETKASCPQDCSAGD